MPNMQATETPLSRDRKSARRLRREIQLHEEDMFWVDRNDGVIIYAVDNDVAKLYSNTKKVAFNNQESDDDSQGYTRIFSGDEDVNAIGIGRILSHYIFYKLGENAQSFGKRILIPPLDAEFSSIFGGVFRDAAEENEQAQSGADSIDALLNSKAMSDIELTQYLEVHAKEILDTLIGQDSLRAELLRLSKLVNENRLVSLNDIDAKEKTLPPQFIEAIKTNKSLVELIWTSDLKSEWIGRLEKFASETKAQAKNSNKRKKIQDDEKNKKNIEDDAEALATLQLINSRLAGQRIRFVMITGALSILRAARDVFVEEGGRKRSFSDLWLRHPRCFLGNPAILGAVAGGDSIGDGNNLVELLDAFLAEGDDNSEEQNRQLLARDNSNSQAVVRQYAGELHNFQNKWNRFSAQLCFNHAEIVKGSDQQQVLELVKRLRSAGGSLKQQLNDAWHSVYLAASQTGFLFTWNLKRFQRRNTPKLRFESFDHASKFIDEVLEQMQKQAGTEIKNFSHRIGEVRSDDPSGYTTYLVFGVLFGAQDQWHVSESLADSALKLVLGNPRTALQAVTADTERVITGREAFYLKAVAGRHLSSTASDLTSAHEAITLAIRMLDLERELRGNILPSDTRFQYELCSINVAAAMFEKFLGDSPQLFGRLTPAEILSRLSDILNKQPTECNDKVCDGSCRERCRILTSMFIVELTLIANVGDTFPEKLRPHLTSFHDLLAGKHVNNPTPLMKTIYAVASWWGETNTSMKARKKADALAAIDSSIEKRQRVAPYEAARNAYLKEFVST